MEEKEILRDLVIDSLNLSRKLIRELTELKLNKNKVYQSCINDYCMKQYKLFKYVKNMDCSTLDDLKLRRYILNIARSYLKVLYTKYLDMIELLYNRRYDEFESSSKKNNYKKRFSNGKFNLIKKLKLISKSFKIKKNKKDIKNLFFSLFDNSEKIINYDSELLNEYSRDFYDVAFLNKSSKILIDILE